ncbi:MAG: HYR domain-containing protein, partial [Bacteroidota bacterium]
MRTARLLAFLVFFSTTGLGILGHLQAQITLTFQDAITCNNQVSAALVIEDDVTLQAFQMTVMFDDRGLSFNSLASPLNPDPLLNTFGDDQVLLSWLAAGTGEVLMPGDTLFTLLFDVIGSPGDYVIKVLDNASQPAVALELVADFMIVDPVNLNDGTIQVEPLEDLGKIYWFNNIPNADTLRCSNQDGSSIDILVDDITPFTRDFLNLQFNTKDSFLYWTDGGLQTISRLSLRDLVIEDFIDNLFFPTGIAIDNEDNFIFISESSQTGNVIARFNLEGQSRMDIVSNNNGSFTPAPLLDIDTANNVLFWLEFTDQSIYRSDYDGSNVIRITDGSVNQAISFAIDQTRQKVYWTNTNDRIIQRSNTDGSNVELVFNLQSTAVQLKIDDEDNQLFWLENGKIFKLDLVTNKLIVVHSPAPANVRTFALGSGSCDPITTFENCPNNLSTNSNPNTCGTTVNWTLPNTISTCGQPSPIINVNGQMTGDFFEVGTDTVQYIVIDPSGASDTCTFTITVEDRTPPEAICEGIDIELGMEETITIDAEELDGGSTDNCGEEELAFELSQTTFTCADFGAQVLTLTVSDISGNSSSCTAIAVVIPGEGCNSEISISDPCICKDNASNLFDGQFDEVIAVDGPPNLDWRVTAVSGLFRSDSPPPPLAPLPIALGTAMVETPVGSGHYELRGIHIDAEGYSIEVFNGFQSLSIGNTCFYPNPVIENLGDTYCLFSEPFELQGNADPARGTGTFTINGQPLTTFDPMTLGIGSFRVVYTFDADDAPGTANPGCIQSIDQFVRIIETPSTLVCNDQVQISLGPDCSVTVRTDDFLEGTYGCFDDYSLEITDQQGNILSNPLNNGQIGQVLKATISHLPSGNQCWSNFTIEDKLIAALECVPLSVLCSDDLSPDALGFPVPNNVIVFQTLDQLGTQEYTAIGYDGCGISLLSYEDERNDFPCQAINGIITRSWQIVDPNGNIAICDQLIELLPAGLADVLPPNNFDDNDQRALLCTNRCPAIEELPDCGTDILGWNTIPEGQAYAGHPSPFDDFYPCNDQIRCFGTGVPNGADCGEIQYTFEDTRIEECATGSSNNCFKVIRAWTLLNWCTGEVRRFDQIIKVRDSGGPSITIPEKASVSVEVWKCGADWLAPLPILMDACGEEDISYTIEIVGSTASILQLANGQYRVNDIAPGLYDVIYRAENCCGSQTEASLELAVIDDVPPVPVCDQFTVVTIPGIQTPGTVGAGTITVDAEVFDDGSFDSCSEVTFAVRRTRSGCGSFTSFRPTVNFCCDDVEEKVQVELLVRDNAGNSSICLIDVEVSDKQAPIVVAPPDITITCDLWFPFDPADPDEFTESLD